MDESHSFPNLAQVVLDTADVRGLAEFYRQLLGYEYRAGDEPPQEGEPDESDWLVLNDPSGNRGLAFQLVDELVATTWPSQDVPQQLHLDLTVSSPEEFAKQHERARQLGAKVLLDRSDDEQEPLRAYADPAGHPFCIYIDHE